MGVPEDGGDRGNGRREQAPALRGRHEFKAAVKRAVGDARPYKAIENYNLIQKIQ